MSGIGFFLAGLMLWSVLKWLLGNLSPEKITQQTWFLRTWIFAAPSALVFMLIFIGFLIPIMLFYNIYNYVVFRGKVVGDMYGE